MTDTVVSLNDAAERRERLQRYGAKYIDIELAVLELCQWIDVANFIYFEEAGRPFRVSGQGPTCGYILEQALDRARRLVSRISDENGDGSDDPAA